MLGDSKVNITVADLAWDMDDCPYSHCCPVKTEHLRGIDL